MDLDIDAFYRDVDAKSVVGGETYRDYFPAVMRAMKSWNNRRATWTEDHRGFTLRFGPDDYWFSHSIHLIRGMRLLGAGGSGAWTGTRFYFPEGVHGLVSEFSKTPIEYDLRLMSVAAADGLINGGRSLVIVALVGTNLHIRIFDASGEKVVDKTENELVSGEALTALKKRLNPLPNESDLSKADKYKIIEDATLIAGHTHVIPAEFSNLPGRSDGSMIEGIYFEANGKGVAECHGIVMIASLVLRDVTIVGFSGDGVHINATLANKNARDYGSASGWLMENCNIDNCQNGIYVRQAADNSAGTAIRVLINNNLEWGIADLSTTGSTYIGCIAHNNKAGSYHTRINPGQSTTNSSLFLNCYAEGDQPPAKIGSAAMVIGGIMNLSEDSNAIWLNAENGYATFPCGIQAYSKEMAGEPTVIGMLGSQDERVALELHASKTPQDIYPYKLRYDDGWWQLHAETPGDTSRSPVKFSTNGASTARERVNVWFENGYFIGSSDGKKKIEMMKSPPTTGDWAIGDQVWNANPVVGGHIGWVYVADPNDPTNPTKYSWHDFGKIN